MPTAAPFSGAVAMTRDGIADTRLAAVQSGDKVDEDEDGVEVPLSRSASAACVASACPSPLSARPLSTRRTMQLSGRSVGQEHLTSGSPMEPTLADGMMSANPRPVVVGPNVGNTQASTADAHSAWLRPLSWLTTQAHDLKPRLVHRVIIKFASKRKDLDARGARSWLSTCGCHGDCTPPSPPT